MKRKLVKYALYLSASFMLLELANVSESMALDNIIRPYQSARAAGMGGVRITTGLYDENFFGNPGRVTQNPNWKVQIFDLMAETTNTTLSTVSDLAGGGDTLTKIGNHAGDNSHGRIQTSFPAVYWPNVGGGRWSYALAILTSTQFDIDLRRSYRVEPQAITDIGPALTVGRKFLDNESLSIGVTGHATYRLASKSGFSFVDLIKGNSLSPLQSGGEGAHLDFDTGAAFDVPWRPGGVVFKPGVSVNNVLGGKYSNLPVHLVKTGIRPIAQPRTYNAGLAATKDHLWKFSETMLALEIQDVGNNPDGSMFRTVHLGMETTLGILSPRVGINQGYLTAGLGLDLKILELDFATYGEEMTLNVGGLQDRRYAVRVGLKI